MAAASEDSGGADSGRGGAHAEVAADRPEAEVAAANRAKAEQGEEGVERREEAAVA